MILSLSEVDLYYEIAGKGPFLFIVQSGEGDANRTAQLVDNLKNQFTVVTYDRRGLSRSEIKNKQLKTTLFSHTNDLHELISFVSDSPVNVLGCSIGAVIALNVAFQYPKYIKRIIAHEPVMPSILSEFEKQLHISELNAVKETYLHDNWIAGIKQMGKVLGINLQTQTKEPDAVIEPLTITRKPNFDFFVEHDFQGIIDFNFPISRLAEIEKHTSVIASVGKETNQNVFDYKCAGVIANSLQKELIYFPGGHNGNCTHPRGYAKMIKMLLKH